MTSGTDAVGNPRFIGFCEWPGGRTDVMLHWREVRVPVSAPVLGFGLATVVALALAVAFLGLRRRTR